jgi:hypothetical protein
MWPIVGLHLIFIAFVILMVFSAMLVLGLSVGGIIGLTALFFPQSGGAENAWAVLPAVGIGLLAFLAVLLVAVVSAVALAIVTQLAQRAVVLEGESLGQALGSGWRLLKGNVGRVLGVLLVQIVVNLLVGIFTTALMLIIIGPPALTVAARQGEAGLSFVLLLVLVAGAAWLVNALVTALPTAWNSTVWTLFYRAATTGLPEEAGKTAGLGGTVPPAIPGAYSR